MATPDLLIHWLRITVDSDIPDSAAEVESKTYLIQPSALSDMKTYTVIYNTLYGMQKSGGQKRFYNHIEKGIWSKGLVPRYGFRGVFPDTNASPSEVEFLDGSAFTKYNAKLVEPPVLLTGPNAYFEITSVTTI